MAAEDVRADFTKAERILAINNPLMQFCIYAVMVFVLSFGSYTVITSRGLDLDVGQMSSLLTYSFQVLMSLMMLSMVFVMITMAAESAQRIVEVLSEEARCRARITLCWRSRTAPSTSTASASSTRKRLAHGALRHQPAHPFR